MVVGPELTRLVTVLGYKLILPSAKRCSFSQTTIDYQTNSAEIIYAYTHVSLYMSI